MSPPVSVLRHSELGPHLILQPSLHFPPTQESPLLAQSASMVHPSTQMPRRQVCPWRHWRGSEQTVWHWPSGHSPRPLPGTQRTC